MRVTALLSLLSVSLLLIGCASTPGGTADPGSDAPALADVRAAPARYQGDTVRWGGTIAGIENKAEVTLIEVVARDLDRGGRPRDRDGSPGRFLAVIDGFLDPAIHKQGRSLTVTGTVDGEEIRPVGEYDYPYVRVQVADHHLWPERMRDPYADDLRHRPPYFGPRYQRWHDPWYDPWYDPWHPYRRGHW